MRTLVRSLALVALGAAVSACGLVAGGGPDDDRPEVFEFDVFPATDQEAVRAFGDSFGPDTQLVPGTLEAVGKYVTSQGPIVFASFTLSDRHGVTDCFGNMGPFGGGWGCGPVGDLDPEIQGDLEWAGGGFGGSWSQAEFRVSDRVDHLVAVAADGTTYRVEPMGSHAWMEWKTIHGNLEVTAFDGEGNSLETVTVDASN